MSYQTSGAQLNAELLVATIEGMRDYGRLTRHRDMLTPVDVSADGIRGFHARVDRDETLREEEAKYSEEAGFSRSTMEVGEATYSCEENGHEKLLSKNFLAKFKRYGIAESVAAKLCTRIVLVEEAKRFRDLLWTNATALPLSGTTGLSVSNEWDDYTNADPVADVLTGIEAINGKCGAEGVDMTLDVNWKTVRDIVGCDKVIERYKYTGELRDNRDYDKVAAMIAELLGVGKVNVLGVVSNPNARGVAGSITQIWDPEYALLRVTAAPGDLELDSVGYQFHYDGPEGMGGQMAMYTYDNPERNITSIVRCSQCTDEKLAEGGTDLAFRFGNLVT